MPIPIGAALLGSAALGLVGSKMSADASKSAARQQQRATDSARQASDRAYNDARAAIEPYARQGNAANDLMGSLLTPGRRYGDAPQPSMPKPGPMPGPQMPPPRQGLLGVLDRARQGADGPPPAQDPNYTLFRPAPRPMPNGPAPMPTMFGGGMQDPRYEAYQMQDLYRR